MTDPHQSAPVSRQEPRRRAQRATPRGEPTPRDLEPWPGWESARGRFGSYARRWLAVEDPARDRRCAVSWGPAELHGVLGTEGQKIWGMPWGPGVRWFVDLEWFDERYLSDPRAKTAAHIERGLAREEDMWAWVAWLRSCVEVAGEEGLRALNARSGGRLA